MTVLVKTRDWRKAARILRHPKVWETAGCGRDFESIGLRDLFDNGAFALLRPDYNGGMICIPTSASEYEGHVQYIPGYRDNVLEEAQWAVDYVLNVCGATSVITSIPAGNFPAERLALRCGFRYVGDLGEVMFRGFPVALRHYQIIRKD